MQLIGMKVETLHDLFVHELKDIYGAEGMVIDSLPKMIDAASSPELKTSFEEHLRQTELQRAKLEECFELLDLEPEAQKCDGMAGILKDGEKVIHARGNVQVRDAGLISAAQKVEHYEIAAYGTLATFAQTMGHDDVAEIIHSILNEEKKTDKLLTQIAEKSVNVSAPQM